MKVAKLYEPVFTAEVTLICGGSIDELSNWYKKKKLASEQDPKLAGYVELVDHTKKDGTVERSYIIRIEENDFYTLSHECIHLVRHILDDRGIPFRPENDEVVAYYHTYWLKRLWRLTNKEKK